MNVVQRSRGSNPLIAERNSLSLRRSLGRLTCRRSTASWWRKNEHLGLGLRGDPAQTKNASDDRVEERVEHGARWYEIVGPRTTRVSVPHRRVAPAPGEVGPCPGHQPEPSGSPPYWGRTLLWAPTGAVGESSLLGSDLALGTNLLGSDLALGTNRSRRGVLLPLGGGDEQQPPDHGHRPPSRTLTARVGDVGPGERGEDERS